MLKNIKNRATALDENLKSCYNERQSSGSLILRFPARFASAETAPKIARPTAFRDSHTGGRRRYQSRRNSTRKETFADAKAKVRKCRHPNTTKN